MKICENLRSKKRDLATICQLPIYSRDLTNEKMSITSYTHKLFYQRSTYQYIHSIMGDWPGKYRLCFQSSRPDKSSSKEKSIEQE